MEKIDGKLLFKGKELLKMVFWYFFEDFPSKLASPGKKFWSETHCSLSSLKCAAYSVQTNQCYFESFYIISTHPLDWIQENTTIVHSTEFPTWKHELNFAAFLPTLRVAIAIKSSKVRAHDSRRETWTWPENFDFHTVFSIERLLDIDFLQSPIKRTSSAFRESIINIYLTSAKWKTKRWLEYILKNLITFSVAGALNRGLYRCLESTH